MSDFKPLYRSSWSEAMECNEQDKWRKSQMENIRCRDFLEEQVRLHYEEYHLETEKVISNTVAEFGWDRTNWVLASHVQYYDYDGRFSPQNKAWAQGIYIPRPADWEKERNPYLRDFTVDYLLQCHNVLADGLVDRARKMYEKLNLYDHRHRLEGDVHNQDFTGKILILRDTTLNESARTPENQLFLAQSGFGCEPDKSGRAVFGHFLIDSEKTRFNRNDFIGVADDKYLPEWALEAFEAYKQEQVADDGPSDEPVMKGM